MKELEIEGKTVEEAIAIALKKLGVKKEEVNIEVVNEGKQGLFGLMGSSPAHIRVKLKKEAEEPGGEVAGEPAIEISGEEQGQVKTVLAKLLGLMDIKGDIETSYSQERIVADIKSPDGAILIGKKGQTLESLQFLTSLIVNRERAKRNDDQRLRVVIDTEGYRKRRAIALEHMAEQAAQEVKTTGKRQLMEPMSAQDRRIVHLSIGDDPELEVQSEGEGSDRRIVVRKKQ
ncbi:MAG: RNA-binding cell elongation regulator Jag/EloR [bacterium]